MRRRQPIHSLCGLLLCSAALADDVPLELDTEDSLPPVTVLTPYDAALAALEGVVAAYFDGLMQARAGATDSQLVNFENALTNKIQSEFSKDDVNLLTPREQAIQIKMIVLRELHAEFANDHLPADLETAFLAWEATRPAAIRMLDDRGEL